MHPINLHVHVANTQTSESSVFFVECRPCQLYMYSVSINLVSKKEQEIPYYSGICIKRTPTGLLLVSV